MAKLLWPSTREPYRPLPTRRRRFCGLESVKERFSYAHFWKTSKWENPLLAFSCLTIFILSGCPSKPLNCASVDQALLKQGNIRRIALLSFESSLDNPQAGSHISKLSKTHLPQTGFYQVAGRGEIEKALKERGGGTAHAATQSVPHQVGGPLQLDGIIYGAVSQSIVSTSDSPPGWCLSKTGSVAKLFLKPKKAFLDP